ncbi:sigma-70 family RNA polymerase sigma factor [Methylobacillus gramineus]|uniref:sigma-70 family RNA polymerase sigma factor n=1 Tax=Methylobacillus gramineus TaxID=755169 RepID=UPI001CFF876F|nr:sigma-70 family RNA polymerase sigma factor [Methylobacillus gramineus]MCB5183991.1 sigma-70 family RNA polymerase sigma factor [Methylobacillus gramineus]
MPAPQFSRDVFHHLYSSHHSWLLSWLRRKVKETEQAADLAQDTFLSILNADNMQDIREPRPFLATIARRLVANYHRRQIIEEAYLDALASLPEAQAHSPEERALALELLQQIDQALNSLPHRAKQAFLLAHLEGLSYAEIAEVLQVSTSSVKQYLSRANQHCFFSML